MPPLFLGGHSRLVARARALSRLLPQAVMKYLLEKASKAGRGSEMKGVLGEASIAVMCHATTELFFFRPKFSLIQIPRVKVRCQRYLVVVFLALV